MSRTSFQFIKHSLRFFYHLVAVGLTWFSGEIDSLNNLTNSETVQRSVGHHRGSDMFVAKVLAHRLDFLRIAAVFHGQTHSRMAEGMGMIVLQTCLG